MISGKQYACDRTTCYLNVNAMEQCNARFGAYIINDVWEVKFE